MNYAEMSDFDVNKAVALLCTIEGVVINDDGCPVKNVIDDSPGSYSGGDYIEFDFDPCNNPADAWPIIFSNRIGIAPGTSTDKWAAHHSDWNIVTKDANPLRAAMVIFLMVKEGEGK